MKNGSVVSVDMEKYESATHNDLRDLKNSPSANIDVKIFD